MLELKRQLWHACSGLLIAVIAYYNKPLVFQAVIIGFLFLLYMVKYLLKKGYEIPIVQDYLFKHMGRENEVGDGSIYFLLGSLITSLFFTQAVTVISISVLSVSDAVATMIGKPYGAHKLYNEKSLEGSTAFLVSSSLILGYNYTLQVALITSIVLTLLELFGGFDDNIIIPPACALLINLLCQVPF